MPCRRAGDVGLFPTPARVIVCLTDLDTVIEPSVETLRKAFGLTPAQAKVAVAFARGNDLPEIAAKLGISGFTVRRHLGEVMMRTDTHSQSALARLLMRLPDLSRPPRTGGGLYH